MANKNIKAIIGLIGDGIAKIGFLMMWLSGVGLFWGVVFKLLSFIILPWSELILNILYFGGIGLATVLIGTGISLLE